MEKADWVPCQILQLSNAVRNMHNKRNIQQLNNVMNKPPKRRKLKRKILQSNANLHINLSTKNYRDLIGLPTNIRSNRSQMFFKIGALKNFTNFTGKHPCWSLFLTKLQALWPATLLKRDSNTSVFL